jgi:hypothetical protein
VVDLVEKVDLLVERGLPVSFDDNLSFTSLSETSAIDLPRHKLPSPGGANIV